MGAYDCSLKKAMAKESLGNVLDYIRQIAGGPGSQELTDQELLCSFAADRDEAAFAVLVQRHGPLVWGVCRRVLHQIQDAEDAFQATFLVLARKAGRIRWQADVSNWLYAVAWRVALKAKSDARRHQRRAEEFQDMPAPEANGDSAWLEIRPVLDEELNRLPLKYRAPVVLHYLQGKTYAQAAQTLGWPAGTVSTRLAQARNLLRRRLARRGIGLATSLLTVALARNAATATAPPSLLDATVKAAMLLAAGQAGAVISTKVFTLTQGVVKAMFLAKLKTSAVVLLAFGVLGVGAGFVGYEMLPGVEAKGPADGKSLALAQDADPLQEDKPKQEIDRLRQENDLLRKELRALSEKVTSLERKLTPKEEETQPVTFQGKPIDYWLQMFKDRDPEYRKKAIDALTAIGTEDKRVLPVLIKALKDRYISREAAHALGNIGKDAVPALLPLLKGKDNELREMAALALSDIGPEAKETIPALIECLEDEDQILRGWAAAALGRMAPESKAAIPPLIKLLDKDDLGRGRGMSMSTTIDALSRFREQAVPALSEALKDPSEKIRAGAAGCLAMIGKPAKGAVPGLILALRDKHPLVQETAHLALIAIEDDAVPALVEAMKDKDPEIRAATAMVLGQMASPHMGPISQADMMGGRNSLHMTVPTAKTAMPALLKAMGDEDERVRNAASGAYEILKKHNGPIAPNVPIERPRAQTDP
jgi:RNA polymerase sigma factor (sigma-70 family)